MPSSFFGNLQLIIVGLIVALVPILVMSIKKKNVIIVISIIILLIISFFISIISDSGKPDINNIENNNEQPSEEEGEEEDDLSDLEPPPIDKPSETIVVVSKPPTTERFVHLETVNVEFGENKECIPGIVWIQIDNITTANDGISFYYVVHGDIIIIGEEKKRINGEGIGFVYRTDNYEITLTKIHTYSAVFVIRTRVF